MKIQMIRFAAIAALATGMVFAQTTTTPDQGHRGARRSHLQHLVKQLDLTADQQTQAREIFQAGAQSTRPLTQQMRDARRQLRQDAKNGASQDVINKDSAALGPLTTQIAAARAETFQKFYGILTADQKAKLDQIRAQRKSRRG
jgi:Spy/CpxP family protein refolding chaperone